MTVIVGGLLFTNLLKFLEITLTVFEIAKNCNDLFFLLRLFVTYGQKCSIQECTVQMSSQKRRDSLLSSWKFWERLNERQIKLTSIQRHELVWPVCMLGLLWGGHLPDKSSSLGMTTWYSRAHFNVLGWTLPS